MSSFLKSFTATLVFAVFHSLLASRPAKQFAARRFGVRSRNGLYRIFYIGISVVSLAGLFAYLLTLPDRILYRARGLLKGVLRLVQAIGLAHAIYAAYHVGITRITGLSSLGSYMQGQAVVPPEPEAQGPGLTGDESLKVTGPFRWSRHPLNFSPLPVFWFNPLMTTRLAGFNLAATVYLIAGSLHEESRLLAAYGSRYAEYQQSSIPFFLPFNILRKRR